MSDVAKRWAALLAIVVYIFLYAPIVSMVVLSFNKSLDIGLPWRGFTLQWYHESIANKLARDAFWNSLQLAGVVSIVASLLGLLLALAFRRRFRGKSVVLYTLLLPLLIPGIVLAVGEITLWNLMGLSPGRWSTALLGHLVYTVPFAFLNIYPRVYRFDPNIEMAAADLGAGPWTTFHTVVLPQIMPGVVASLLFSFTVSFDEFTRTLFLIGSENTLPIYFWSIVLSDPSPSTSAIATLSMLFSLGVVGLAALLISRGRRRTTGLAMGAS